MYEESSSFNPAREMEMFPPGPKFFDAVMQEALEAARSMDAWKRASSLLIELAIVGDGDITLLQEAEMLTRLNEPRDDERKLRYYDKLDDIAIAYAKLRAFPAALQCIAELPPEDRDYTERDILLKNGVEYLPDELLERAVIAAANDPEPAQAVSNLCKLAAHHAGIAELALKIAHDYTKQHEDELVYDGVLMRIAIIAMQQGLVDLSKKIFDDISDHSCRLKVRLATAQAALPDPRDQVKELIAEAKQNTYEDRSDAYFRFLQAVLEYPNSAELVEQAEIIGAASAISSPYYRALALSELAAQLQRPELLDQAVMAVAQVEDINSKSAALQWIRDLHGPTVSKHTISEQLTVIMSHDDEQCKEYAARRLIEDFAETGDIDTARQLLGELEHLISGTEFRSDYGQRALRRAIIQAEAQHNGEYKLAAESRILEVTDEWERDKAIRSLIAGAAEQASEQEIMDLLRAIRETSHKIDALRDIAQARHDTRYLASAATIARTIADPFFRSRTLRQIAETYVTITGRDEEA